MHQIMVTPTHDHEGDEVARARWGAIVYFGSRAEAGPALKMPWRVRAEAVTRAVPDRTASARPPRTAPPRTAPPRTAPPRTAPPRTAPPRTAPPPRCNALLRAAPARPAAVSISAVRRTLPVRPSS